MASQASDVEPETGIPWDQFFQGPLCQWAGYRNALLTLPKIQHEQGVPDDLIIVVMVQPELEAGRGLFRDCRWNYDDLVFVDVVTGDKYGEEAVYGWAVAQYHL